jgi:hypothetical protein
MKIEKLFNYRPNGNEITLNDGTTKVKVMAIRKGPRGIIAMVKEKGPTLIWDKELADEHLGDSEEDLLSRIQEVIG